MKKHVDVVGAVILRDGLVLCAQRGAHADQAGLWEFPGGKVELDEDPEAALAREIKEELGCEISVGDEVTTTIHDYETLTVTLTTFHCRLVSGTPIPHEHVALRWLHPDQLTQLVWAPADLPTVAILSV